MKFLATLVTLLALVVIGTATDYSHFTISGKCRDAPDVDWTTSINAYLRRIPRKITYATLVGHYPIPGIELGEVNVRGLRGFSPYKPYTTFCIANNTFLEVFVFADSPGISVEWMACSGQYGNLGAFVSGSTLRLLFMATPSEEEPRKLQLRKVYPQTAGDAKVYITGGSKVFQTLADVVTVMARPYIQILWNHFLLEEAALLIEEEHLRLWRFYTEML